MTEQNKEQKILNLIIKDENKTKLWLRLEKDYNIDIINFNVDDEYIRLIEFVDLETDLECKIEFDDVSNVECSVFFTTSRYLLKLGDWDTKFKKTTFKHYAMFSTNMLTPTLIDVKKYFQNSHSYFYKVSFYDLPDMEDLDRIIDSLQFLALQIRHQFPKRSFEDVIDYSKPDELYTLPTSGIENLFEAHPEILDEMNEKIRTGSIEIPDELKKLVEETNNKIYSGIWNKKINDKA